MLRGAIIIASIGGLALWAMARVGRDLDEALAGAFGDWPAVPEGMLLAAELVGERTAKTASTQTLEGHDLSPHAGASL